ncbi:glycoside hydrolase family 16 protein [Corallococcus sp. CA041A]|uniref:glycoside hydrolase family 16 protein n=1 Tax=Corallococcus sp. CA041A TaxID=2316727 RepID=UPI000EA335A7|nr:glycoside hydrolase family 16 protein [Corallococcus sp. CA041A]RKH26280.1 glycoside hydrolase family 16 protein [Corallococcus sp. CA041A]
MATSTYRTVTAWALVAGLMACAGAPKRAGTVAGAADGWVQVWSDEFDGTEVDASNWRIQTEKLTARIQTANGYPFTSGRVESAGKREFKHGRVEARIKLPVGVGLWPAFWMLGGDIHTAGWPACGELDIMENVGYGDWVSVALHGPGYSGNTPINGRFFPRTPVSDWHEYGVESSPEAIHWYIDGERVKTSTREEVERHGAWAYDKPLFIIFNFAVGGGYPEGVNKAKEPYFGVPQATADLLRNAPQTMEVDWVRVSEKR